MGVYFLRGAYFHGVVINACNFLIVCAVVWERISCAIFRPSGSFPANFCPMFIAVLEPRYSQQSIDCCQTLAHQCKALGINESIRGFC